MPALAEPRIRMDGDRPVLIGEGHHVDSRLLDEPGQKTPTARAELRGQHEASFDQGRGADSGRARGKRFDERVPARLSEDDRHQRRSVDDHTPSGPNPRICSRSRLLLLRPRIARGTWGQTSLSRKRKSSAWRFRTPVRIANRARLSWRATLTARVLVSPARAATSAARRSVSRSLMFKAMVALSWWKSTSKVPRSTRGGASQRRGKQQDMAAASLEILVINPNTTVSMTAKIRRAAEGAAGPGTLITAVNPKTGPESI